MALFWPVWGLYWEVYWELHWGLYWREGAAGGELFFWAGKRQGDSEAQGNYRRAQEGANAPLFQSTEQVAY
jgi:hypothetical protein